MDNFAKIGNAARKIVSTNILKFPLFPDAAP